VKNMLVHDLRLIGRSPSGMATNTFDVPEKMPTSHVVGWISTYATQQGGLDNLYVMCHGYEAGVEDSRAQVSTYALGDGLALGDPGLQFGNVALCNAWNGHISKITLFACGPGNTRPGYENTRIDGRRFCGELALISGAEVIAAIETQYYYHTPTWYESLRGRDGEIDFGEWEGPVFRFSPDTGQGSRVT
jgi:hypothetical protein